MKILDTTVRDGSYAVEFKFSCKDVQDLVGKSHRIGLEYIEIGHGLGLNASSNEHGISLQTDTEYMEIAKTVSGDSKLGFFCIPEIARLEDIKIAKDHGMNFIRIGVPTNKLDKAIPYIDACRKNELEVFVNFMKSYATPVDDFAKSACRAYEAGADCIYIVDSAGSMCSEEIGSYIDATRSLSNVKIGFHGHNNLGLAVDNTIFAINKNIDFVDCSFQGLGRSIGNASLEQVVMVMEKMGYKTGFDIPRVLEYGYAGLRNIVRDRNLINPLDYMCGYSGFHSAYLKDIYRCCSEKNVDPLRLIMLYSQKNKLTMDYEELRKTADMLPKDLDDNPYSFVEFFSTRYNE